MLKSARFTKYQYGHNSQELDKIIRYLYNHNLFSMYSCSIPIECRVKKFLNITCMLSTNEKKENLHLLTFLYMSDKETHLTCSNDFISSSSSLFVDERALTE